MSELNPPKADEFASRMLDVPNHSFLALMASIGHQTGLFDVMAELGPSASAGIARAAGLNERHVREWLGAMVPATSSITPRRRANTCSRPSLRCP